MDQVIARVKDIRTSLRERASGMRDSVGKLRMTGGMHREKRAGGGIAGGGALSAILDLEADVEAALLPVIREWEKRLWPEEEKRRAGEAP